MLNLSKEEYEKTVIRMMDSIRKTHKGELNCKGVVCEGCPMRGNCGPALEAAYSVIKIVEKWGKEHPIVTNADKYREVFGVNPVGVVSNEFICPSCAGFNCDCSSDKCTACKTNFWTSEYKAPKGE